MFTKSFIIALLLIVGGKDAKEAKLDKEYDNPYYRACLFRIGLKLELVDMREEWAFFDAGGERYDPQDVIFNTDLSWLQYRWRKFRDAPHLGSLNMFPPKDVIESGLEFNQEYLSYMEARMEIDFISRRADYQVIIDEINDLSFTWELLREAQTEYYNISERRSKLIEIRRRIGYDKYYSGELVPCVPIWRFERIK